MVLIAAMRISRKLIRKPYSNSVRYYLLGIYDRLLIRMFPIPLTIICALF